VRIRLAYFLSLAVEQFNNINSTTTQHAHTTPSLCKSQPLTDTSSSSSSSCSVQPSRNHNQESVTSVDEPPPKMDRDWDSFLFWRRARNPRLVLNRLVLEIICLWNILLIAGNLLYQHQDCQARSLRFLHNEPTKLTTCTLSASSIHARFVRRDTREHHPRTH